MCVCVFVSVTHSLTHTLTHSLPLPPQATLVENEKHAETALQRLREELSQQDVDQRQQYQQFMTREQEERARVRMEHQQLYDDNQSTVARLTAEHALTCKELKADAERARESVRKELNLHLQVAKEERDDLNLTHSKRMEETQKEAQEHLLQLRQSHEDSRAAEQAAAQAEVQRLSDLLQDANSRAQAAEGRARDAEDVLFTAQTRHSLREEELLDVEKQQQHSITAMTLKVESMQIHLQLAEKRYAELQEEKFDSRDSEVSLLRDRLLHWEDRHAKDTQEHLRAEEALHHTQEEMTKEIIELQARIVSYKLSQQQVQAQLEAANTETSEALLLVHTRDDQLKEEKATIAVLRAKETDLRASFAASNEQESTKRETEEEARRALAQQLATAERHVSSLQRDLQQKEKELEQNKKDAAIAITASIQKERALKTEQLADAGTSLSLSPCTTKLYPSLLG